jgi:VIT1/CCC1 family predicted Fe2+/Mn2+ transporter
MAEQELHHYNILKKYTQVSVSACLLKAWCYRLIFHLFGITFGIKLMEKGESDATEIYIKYWYDYPEIAAISIEEEKHEEKLIAMIKDDSLNFIGAIVLGMNDALVELTGALAGFTLALRNSLLIALLGGITGIAAGMSMAASGYFASKSENGTKFALKSAAYTGISYFITVAILIIPYIFIKNALIALLVTLLCAMIIIAIFNFYYAVVKEESFRKRFIEMLTVSFTVVGISFVIGYLLKKFTGINM